MPPAPRIDIVELPEGFRIAVPRWMLDSVTCGQLPQEAKPRAGLKALLRLVELLNRLPAHFQRAVSEASPPTKGEHASNSIDPILSTLTAPSQEEPLGSIARSDAPAVPPGAGPTAASSGAGKSQAKQ